jgi:broad specificity phosphatase PhoE
MTLRLAVLVAALVAIAAPAAWAQKAVVLVRHAEKVDESDDPLLSAKGEARARALSRALAGAGVKAIYVTEYKRTGLTAAPLAAALGLEPVANPADATPALVARLRKEHPADVVLVVGHSNTLPDILKELGHPDPVTIDSGDYGSLFVVVPRTGGPPVVLRLGY